MKKTQLERLRRLSDWQVRQIDAACRRVALDGKKNEAVTNGAFLSFLNVFATALANVNTASLKAFHAAFALLNRRALSGDTEAKEVVDELALVLQDAASLASADDVNTDDEQTAQVS